MPFFLCSLVLTGVGLFLDITGAVLVFLYGLPAISGPVGRKALVEEEEDKEELRRAHMFNIRSHVGIALLVVGFFLQFLGVVLSLIGYALQGMGLVG